MYNIPKWCFRLALGLGPCVQVLEFAAFTGAGEGLAKSIAAWHSEGLAVVKV